MYHLTCWRSTIPSSLSIDRWADQHTTACTIPDCEQAQALTSQSLPQVELQSIQSFYTEQQKSPFKFFPWKQGSMTFRFLPVSWAPSHKQLIRTLELWTMDSCR